MLQGRTDVCAVKDVSTTTRASLLIDVCSAIFTVNDRKGDRRSMLYLYYSNAVIY